MQEYTKTVIKLCGIDHHFHEAGAASVKLHNEVGVRMFQSAAGYKETIPPFSWDFVPIQEQSGSWIENPARQRYVRH